MEVLKFNQKTKTIIINEDNKKEKYHFAKIYEMYGYKILYLKKYILNFIPPYESRIDDIQLQTMFSGAFQQYLESTTKSFFNDKCGERYIALQEDNGQHYFYDSNEIKEIFESIKLVDKLNQ